MIKTVRMYRQYKPVFTQLNALKSPQERETYTAEHKTQLDHYNTAAVLINRSKKADGTLPKTEKLNLEIEKLQALKDNILVRQNKAKAKLSSYENLKHNLDQCLDKKAIQNTKKRDNKQNTIF